MLSDGDKALAQAIQASALLEVKTMDKSILEMVHSTAQDLHQAGVMKGITLRGFDALCLPFVQEPIKRGSRGKTSGRRK